MARSFLTRWLVVCITCFVFILLITRSQRSYERLSSLKDAPYQTENSFAAATWSKDFGIGNLDKIVQSGKPKLRDWLASISSSSPSSFLSSVYYRKQQRQRQQNHLQGTYENSINKSATRTLVVAASWVDDTAWLSQQKEQDPDLRLKLYHVQDHASPNKVPANKGHEAMVYLTYIIDALSASSRSSNETSTEGPGLTDVQIFIHAHGSTWHNNDLLNGSTPWMISRLDSNKVMREGFFNLRCHWGPGCNGKPLEPGPCLRGEKNATTARPEECELGVAWGVFFPNETVPEAISTPCCAQFAVSREQIVRIPLERYVAMRDWLLETTLSDSVSGRIFEYTWHYLFGQQYESCPDTEWACYCDAYGICFDDGPAGYATWIAKSRRVGELKQKADDEWNMKAERIRIEEMKAEDELLRGKQSVHSPDLPQPAPQRDIDAWHEEVQVLEGEILRTQAEAVHNGDDDVRRTRILHENQGKGDRWKPRPKGQMHFNGHGSMAKRVS